MIYHSTASKAVSSHTCSRGDLSTSVLIFAGLFVTATALCGAMDTAGDSALPGEASGGKVAVNEHAIGRDDSDLFAVCDRDSARASKLAGSAGRKCRKPEQKAAAQVSLQ